MNVSKVTPILVVEAIEPNLPFWTGLGYSLTAEVPHGDRLGFVILAREASEVMLQTHASVAEDLPAVAARLRAGGSLLFVEVGSLAEAKRASASLELLVPERTTSYGMKEIFVATKDGHVVGFAERT